jgi:hypothetical protein
VQVRDDLAAILDAVLVLASVLVSGGPWWQEAKAKCPLLLIETLHMVLKVSPQALPANQPVLVTVVGLGARLACCRCASLCPGRLDQVLISSCNLLELAARAFVIAACLQDLLLVFSKVGIEQRCQMLTSGPSQPVKMWSMILQGTSAAHSLSSPAAAQGTGAAALESTAGIARQPSVASTAASTSGQISSSSSRVRGATRQGHIYLTNTAMDVAIRLYSLTADPEIVGVGGSRPASWLSSTSVLMQTSLNLLTAIPCVLDGIICNFIDRNLRSTAKPRPGSSSSSSTGGSALSDAVVQEALQLAALLPHTPWAEFKAAALQNAAHLSPDAKETLEQLGLYMCTAPLLRVVSMLALLGKLSEGQKQGVVALLEGFDNDCSTAASTGRASLPVEEPAALAEHRQEHGITLVMLSTAVLWDIQVAQLYAKHKVKSVTGHLVLAFGAQQLRMIATVDAALAKHASPNTTMAPEAEVSELLEGPLGDVYLGWVQASLLKVISEVLHQAGVMT